MLQPRAELWGNRMKCILILLRDGWLSWRNKGLLVLFCVLFSGQYKWSWMEMSYRECASGCWLTYWLLLFYIPTSLTLQRIKFKPKKHLRVIEWGSTLGSFVLSLKNYFWSIFFVKRPENLYYLKTRIVWRVVHELTASVSGTCLGPTSYQHSF